MGNPLSRPLDGPASTVTLWRLMDRGAWALFLLYWLLAAGSVAGVALLVRAIGPELKLAVLDYILPANFRMAGQMLLESFFGHLGERVLANFALQGGMAAVSVACCVVKELLSRRIEHTNPLLQEGHAPWPLWRQVLEELKFVVLYLLAYNVIFWLGYPPYGPTRTAAQVLSYVSLFVFFNVTFMCPLFLRHRVGYGRMVRTFLARPLQAFGFAAVWCAPSLLAIHLLGNVRTGLALTLVLLAHVAVTAPAAVAGTWLAARLLPVAQAMRPAGWFLRVLGWGVMLAVLVASGVVTTRLATSLNAKTQILKCQYKLDWSTLDYRLPSLSDLSVGLSFVVEITNPTEIDVRIERSRVEVRNSGKYFSEVRLAPIAVPAGQTVRQPVSLSVEIALSRLLEWRELIQGDWEVTWWIEVEEGWEFPVYFR
jgi:hypothetical protein